MRLTSAQRSALREKFGGRCAYCGEPLGDRWHADHVEPVVRNDWLSRIGMDNRPPSHPQRDNIDNMNPACPPCNIDKHSMPLEVWRGVIQRSNEVLQRDISTFRRAVRYGLVDLREGPVVFYFEKLAASQGQGDSNGN